MIDGDRDFIFSIFERLNTGGENLTEMEIRSCLYRGKLLSTLNDIRHTEEWRGFASKFLTIDGKRLEDLEFILKIFALATSWRDYKPSLKKFLNSYCKNNQNQNVEQLKKHFLTLITSESLLIFIRSISDSSQTQNKKSTKIKSQILESLISGILSLLNSGVRYTIPSQNTFLNESIFKAQQGTASKATLTKRMECVIKNITITQG